jgi:hypothetical protein
VRNETCHFMPQAASTKKRSREPRETALHSVELWGLEPQTSRVRF